MDPGTLKANPSSKAHGKLGRARMAEVGLVFVKLG